MKKIDEEKAMVTIREQVYIMKAVIVFQKGPYVSNPFLGRLYIS